MSPLLATRHPLWRVSLCLLALNDHVLKGAHVLPAWLTGKLSDFTGLIVAPVVLAILVRVRTRTAFVSCFVATSFVFSLVKTSHVVSSWYEGLLSWIDAKNVVDPTDLVALAFVPIAFVVLARSASVHPAPATPSPSRAPSLALAVTALLFCVGTPAPSPEPCPKTPAGCHRSFRSALWVGNGGVADVSLTVRTSSATTEDCNVDALSCNADLFEAEGMTITLAPGQAHPIAATGPCVAMHVATADGAGVIVMGGPGTEEIGYTGSAGLDRVAGDQRPVPKERGGLIVKTDDTGSSTSFSGADAPACIGSKVFEQGSAGVDDAGSDQ